MSQEPPLDLPEELLLLALRAQEGSVRFGRPIDLALAAAVLVDLALRGHVVIGEDRSRRVAPAEGDRSLTGRPVLDDALTRLRGSRKERPLSSWLSRLCGGRLRHRVAQGLVARGILAHEKDKILWIFPRHRYPEIDPAPEAAVRAELEAAITTDAAIEDPRVACLVALAKLGGGLDTWLPKELLKRRRERIEAITRGDALAQGTMKGVQEVQAAVVAAAIIPAVFSSTIVAVNAANG